MLDLRSELCIVDGNIETNTVEVWPIEKSRQGR